MLQVYGLLWVILLPSLASAETRLNGALGRVTMTCQSPGAKRQVWLFKQWHLAPGVDTRGKSPKEQEAIPQGENQTAIYQQLDEWIQKKKIKEIYSEGCAGELTETSLERFNGWTVEELKKISQMDYFSKIVSNVPMKLEAKYGKDLKTLCGDELALIKANLLAFSDARGTLGFMTRLSQYKNDPIRAKPYLEGVVSLYRMPPSTDISAALVRLKSEVRAAGVRIMDAIERRNQYLVTQLKNSQESEVAVVFGGVHAPGLVRKLEEAGIGCSVIEPTGYRNDEGELLEKLNQLLRPL